MAEDLLTTKKTNCDAGEALFLAMKCAYRLDQLADEQNRLSNFKSEKNIHQSVKYEAIRWQMKYKIAEKQIQNAYSLALSVSDTTFYGREILLDLAIELLDKWCDLEEATKVLDMMVAKYPDKETLEIREDILDFYKKYLFICKEKEPKVVSSAENLKNSLQNYPNPGNPTTNIVFCLAETRRVELKVFNIIGQEVRSLVNDFREAGAYSVIWDGRNNQGLEVPSGIYLYRLQVGEHVFTKKLTLLK